MAHVMLPGVSPGGKGIQRTRYAADAIDEIIERMRHSGVRGDDVICKNIIGSVIKILNEKHIKIKAKTLGGTVRRSVSLDIDDGTVRYTEGDGKRTEIHTDRKTGKRTRIDTDVNTDKHLPR